MIVNSLEVRGATAPSGNQYLCICQGDNHAWVPRSRLIVNHKCHDELAKKGVFIVDNADVKELTEKVKGVIYFPSANIVEHPGWNGPLFALPDGNLASPTQGEPTEVAFIADPHKCLRAGSLKAWRNSVVAPLHGQVLGEFCLMMPFVGPLLRFMPDVPNFGIELVGPAGVGKSTLQQIASSVMGKPDGEHRYYVTLDTTLNAVETIMQEHRDLLIVFDEANLFLGGAAPKLAAEAYKALAFKISAGDHKRRLDEERTQSIRTAILVSANRSLRELADPKAAGDRAAGDRLMTIRIPDDWAYGVYASLPPEFPTGAAYSEALKAAARANHGVAIRYFLKKLVKRVAADSDRLEAELKASMDRFLDKVPFDTSRGSDYRVAKSFAAIYAAGELAKALGVLPKDFRSPRASMACLELHFQERVAFAPFADRLRALTGDSRIRSADLGITDAERANAYGALWRKTRPEIRIPPEKIAIIFPDWNRIRGQDEVRSLLRMDGEHLTVNAPLFRGDAKRRLHCFYLPPGADSTGEGLFDQVGR